MSSIRTPRASARSPASRDDTAADRPAPRGTQTGPAVLFAGLSDIGTDRPHNEDRWQVVASHGVMVLADGMGGYSAGEVAAELAVQTVCQLVPDLLDLGLDPLEALSRGMAASNEQILEFAAGNPDCRGMGTTLVAAILAGSRLHLAHVGDSRGYLFRSGQLRRLTRDHSIGQEIVDAGKLSEAEVRELAARGILTRALGVEEVLLPELQSFDWQVGDTLLLCSDGLTDLVTDPAVEQLLVDCAAHGPAAQVKALIRGALQAGGADNVTAIVARAIDDGRHALPGPAARSRAH